jgi:Ca2+-binding RTX toxin-like protein
MGQNPDTGLLSFNIIRIGNPLSAFTINWALTGDGGAPVSAADFAPGTALSGTVSFDVAQITQENADGTYEERFQHASDAPTNIRRVELEVAGDLLDEVPEGYRITLTGGAGAPLLGTHVASGTLIDTMLTPGGPIMGTPGPDILDGTAGPDEIVGLDGADVLRGLGGDDTLEGGDGPDTLVGGDGNDRLIGGNSAADLRDLIYGGEGQDSIDGGYGNDELRGDAGNDTITGGAGVDTIIGGVGDDVLTGQTWSDVILGGNGRDFINGGFGHDRVNGGAHMDRFYHLGVEGHGSDWVQDFSNADGDVLVFGGTGASVDDFQVNYAQTAGAGQAGVAEAFVIYKPGNQILWALVDGGALDEIGIVIGGTEYDLLG